MAVSKYMPFLQKKKKLQETWVSWLFLDLAKKEKQRQQAWRVVINEILAIEVLAKVRHCANTGLVLGTESFRDQVHRLRN